MCTDSIRVIVLVDGGLQFENVNVQQLDDDENEKEPNEGGSASSSSSYSSLSEFVSDLISSRIVGDMPPAGVLSLLLFSLLSTHIYAF